jgi:glycosyltransferase involved in cell wall biosynthesis
VTILSKTDVVDMLNLMKISVIIPCFNDEVKLKSITNELHKCKYVQEIIVVDDGSSDVTRNLISQIKDITVVTHPTNLGKTKALLSGLMKASCELVLFVDSDLNNFSNRHVRAMYDNMIERNMDLVLGLREKEVLYMKWIGFAQVYTGERMIRRSLLLKHVDLFSVDNYLIEPEINRLFFREYKVCGVILKNLEQTYKAQKDGIAGFIRDLKMYRSYVRHLGLEELLFQMRFGRAL